MCVCIQGLFVVETLFIVGGDGGGSVVVGGRRRHRCGCGC